METAKKHVRTFIADGRSQLDKMAEYARVDASTGLPHPLRCLK